MVGRFASSDVKFKLKRKSLLNEIEIFDEPWDLCPIYNDYLLTANYFQSSLSLYDKNFELIRVLDAIDNLSFKSLSIATNDQINRLYISDFFNNRVIMTNYEFQLVSVFGEYGKNFRQFNGPSGICCYEESVFICDYYNERVQQLTSTLKYENTFILYLTPFYIKISDSIAAIKSDDEDLLFFYQLPHFSLRSKYEQSAGAIFLFDQKFYQFDYLSLKIVCYDENGDLNEEFKINEYEDVDFDDWTCVVQIKERIVISPGSSFKFFVNN